MPYRLESGSVRMSDLTGALTGLGRKVRIDRKKKICERLDF